MTRSIRKTVILACSAGALVFAFALSLAAQYPPETQAIPIPKMEDLPLLDGPFKPTVESLQEYKCPDWFRDGKFGIWAHWGPQSVSEAEDWFARSMYIQGSHEYQEHLQAFGHPSKSGYKDMLPLWKAEKWDPDRLMALYKKAGAHYFVCQAVFHDNFDNWNSKYHKWNSVNIGPHRDMVGTWKAAALKQGLPFGCSEHLGHSFDFMQTSHGSDATGPLAGVPYDGANPAYWDLYQRPAKNGGWYAGDDAWAEEWYARIYDLIDQYKPDLLYSDGGLPYGQKALSIVAQLYNLSVQQNGGKLEAVYTCKKNYMGTDFHDGICVQDVERGGMSDIQPYPWQTDTSTGEWFYRKGFGYKSTDAIIHTLVDIVSKNGNLLLNVVLYPDGSLPPEMETFLAEMADWTQVNGEAIFKTRPWTIFGEGPASAIKQGAFNDNVPFTARDIRFTRNGSDLYVTTLGVPTGQVVVRALASDSPLVSGDPASVTLLGSADPVKWSRDANGLTIELPEKLPCKSALCFKITGLTTVDNLDAQTLSDFKDKLNDVSISPEADGSLQLPASAAAMHGSTVRIDNAGGIENIGWWQKPEDSVSWKLKDVKPGSYQVSIEMAAQDADSEFVVGIGSEQLDGKSVNTGGFYNYRAVDIGSIPVDGGGAVTLEIKPKSAESWKPINIRSVSLKPVPAP